MCGEAGRAEALGGPAANLKEETPMLESEWKEGSGVNISRQKKLLEQDPV